MVGIVSAIRLNFWICREDLLSRLPSCFQNEPLKALKSKRTSDIVDAVNGSRVGAIKRGEIWSCHICYYFGKCKMREPRNGLVFILLRSLEYCKLQEPHLDWEEVNFSNPLAYHFFSPNYESKKVLLQSCIPSSQSDLTTSSLYSLWLKWIPDLVYIISWSVSYLQSSVVLCSFCYSRHLGRQKQLRSTFKERKR